MVSNPWKVQMGNCAAWKSGTARKSSLNLVTNQAEAKEEGRVKLTENVFAVDALVTSEQIAEPRRNQWRTSEICSQRERCWKLQGRRNRDFAKCAFGDHRFGVL